MSEVKAFFDTNVLIYLLCGDESKANRAEEVIASGGYISVQVLNECANVARRKLGMSWLDVREILSQLRSVCTVLPVTEEVHDKGVDLVER